MTQFRAQYRLRMMKPRSQNDAAESQVLQAASGDLFQVATVDGVTGYEPIMMEDPRGRSGRIDAREKSADTGSLTILLLDRRESSASNLSRWVTQFLGNSLGENQWIGNKIEIDESLDCDPASPGSATWARYWTGRVSESQMVSATVLGIVVRDMSEDLKADIFIGRPHSSVSYYSSPRIWPLGIAGSWGQLEASPVIRGTLQNASVGTGRSILIDEDGLKSAYNAVSQELLRHIETNVEAALDAGRVRAISPQVRARLRVVSSGAVTEHYVTAAKLILLPFSDGAAKVKEIFLTALPAGEEFQGSIPSNGTVCEVSILPALSAPSEQVPILIDDVHPVQLAKDMLDGKWTYRAADGSTKRSWPYNATNLNALIADTTLGTLRFRIDDVQELRDFLEKEICQVVPLAYRMNAEGELEFVDMRIPTGASPASTTITDDDLVADEVPEWQQGRSGAITSMIVGYNYDRVQTPEDAPVTKDGLLGVASPASLGLIESLEREVSKPDFGRPDLGDETFEIKAMGLRVHQGETVNGANAEDAMIGRVEGLMQQYRQPFASGPMEATLTCRRTANIVGIQQGDWRLVDVDMLPDPATNQRGGTRLMRALEVTYEGPRIKLRMLDAGPNVIKTAPTLGVLTLPAANAVAVPVTLNANTDWAEIQAAVTSTSVTLLANVPDGAWVTRHIAAASGTVTLTGFGSGKRVWIRARSVPGFSKVPGIPSGWVSPATPFKDIAALSAVTSLTAATITAKRTQLTWSLGSTQHPLLVRLVTPSSGTPTQVIAYLPKGTKEFWVEGTENAATYKARVTHVDTVGGESPAADVSWTASGASPVCPAMVGLAVEGIL